MAISVKSVSTAISASTTSASAAIPSIGADYIRVVNPTTALCYVATSSGAATATAANIAVGAYSTSIFRIDPSDINVAVLLSAGTGTIAVSRCSQSE